MLCKKSAAENENFLYVLRVEREIWNTHTFEEKEDIDPNPFRVKICKFFGFISPEEF